MEKLLPKFRETRTGKLTAVFFFSGLMILLMLLSGCQIKSGNENRQLFSSTGKTMYPDQAMGAPAFAEPWLRYRQVELSKEILENSNLNIGDRINLSLFEDRNYSAVIDRMDSYIEGALTIRARIDGTASGILMISSEGGAVLGMVIIPESEEYYVISTLGEDGKIYLREVNTHEMVIPEDGSPAIPPDTLDISKAIIQNELDVISTMGYGISNFWAIENFYALITTAETISFNLISMLQIQNTVL